MAVNVPDTARCRVCDYMLRGLPGPVCPECGTRFDPNDPATFKDPARPKQGRARKPLKPVSIDYLCVLGCLVAGLILWKSSVAGALKSYRLLTEDGGCWTCIVLFAPVVDYLRRCIALLDRRAMATPSLLEEFYRHPWRRRVHRVLVALLVIAMIWPWPAKLRFYASRPAFEVAANNYLVNPSAPTDPQWIGLFHVEQIWGRGQGLVWFQVQHKGADVRYGIVRYQVDSGGCGGISLGDGWYLEWW